MKSNTNGFLKDPRFRGRYMEFLYGKAGAPHNPPGVDLNRGQQALAAQQGQQTYRTAAAPLQNPGMQLQQAVRNRSTEQTGANRPALTHSFLYGTPRRS